MKPTYFDMTVRDLKAARIFFEKVLGWRFERFPMLYEYYRTESIRKFYWLLKRK